MKFSINAIVKPFVEVLDAPFLAVRVMTVRQG